MKRDVSPGKARAVTAKSSDFSRLRLFFSAAKETLVISLTEAQRNKKSNSSSFYGLIRSERLQF